MEIQHQALVDATVRYLACRCSHCFRPIAAYAVGPLGPVHCDEHCARADAALKRRLRQATEQRVRVSPLPPARSDEPAPPWTRGRAAWLALQLIGVPVPIVAVLYVLSRYL